jgi:hypothetical protein
MNFNAHLQGNAAHYFMSKPAAAATKKGGAAAATDASSAPKKSGAASGPLDKRLQVKSNTEEDDWSKWNIQELRTRPNSPTLVLFLCVNFMRIMLQALRWSKTERICRHFILPHSFTSTRIPTPHPSPSPSGHPS